MRTSAMKIGSSGEVAAAVLVAQHVHSPIYGVLCLGFPKFPKLWGLAQSMVVVSLSFPTKRTIFVK